MKYSFILPIYRKTMDQVKKSIASLKEQSHKDIEIICVFDGPDPVVESYVDSLTDVKKEVIEHGGASKARNAGAKLATGGAICFWDCDCYATPEMVATWETYWKDSDADFLYSGYRWTDPRIPGFESEPFNAWLLSKYNYISSMSPIKKEKVLEWDESLEGLQDWDYWRRMVEAGARGLYIPCGQNAVAAGWETDFPDKGSISGVEGRSTSVGRIEKVREKHGDKKSDILVYGTLLKPDAVNIAQMLEADYFNTAFWITREYKVVLLIGFNPSEMEAALSFVAGAGENAKRIIYWTGIDAEMTAEGPYRQVKKLVDGAKKHIRGHLCQDLKTQQTLEEIGIEAEICSLPMGKGKILGTLPEKFRVFVFADQEMNGLADSLIKALPDVDIDKFEEGKNYSFSNYNLIVHLTHDKRLITPSRNMLLHGRHMISNAQEPYAGYIDTTDITKFKEEAIAKIREQQANPTFNKDAQDYYMDLMSPERFKAKILSYAKTELEVVNA